MWFVEVRAGLHLDVYNLNTTINYYPTPPYCEFQFAPITEHDYVKTQALRYAHDNDHVMNEQIAVG